jgi:hypothetical protein
LCEFFLEFWTELPFMFLEKSRKDGEGRLQSDDEDETSYRFFEGT